MTPNQAVFVFLQWEQRCVLHIAGRSERRHVASGGDDGPG